MENAKKCKTKMEFCKKYGQGYQIALANNWLKDYTWFNKKGVQKTP